MLRHDVRADGFPERSFDLVHVRAVLMHIADRMAVLRRMASWLEPGGWLMAEEADFGMWLADYDPLWAAHPAAWHEAFPHGSLGQGPALAEPMISAGVMTAGEAARLAARPADPDFLGCGFAFICAWGRRPRQPA